MSPLLIAGPAVEPVTLAAMRDYLRLDDAAEDDLVTALVKAARLLVEASCGRQLIEQTWRITLDRWPAGRIVTLPVSPLMRVARIRLYDAAGAGADLAASLYRADTASDPPRVIVEPTAPEPGRAGQGVEIDIVAGFGPAAADVPAPLVQAIRLLVARWFENRGDGPADALPPDIAALAAPFRRTLSAPRKTLSIGARGRRFVLELPLESPDGFGGVVRTYAAGAAGVGRDRDAEGRRARPRRPPRAGGHASRHHALPRRRHRGEAAYARPAPIRDPRCRRSRRRAPPPRLPRRGDLGMSGPILALRAAILARLSADAELAALMGGALRLHDEPPRAAEPVYAVFGDAAARDASSDLSEGHEHAAAIVVWATPGSAKTALVAAERMADLLHDAALALAGHRLVLLRVAAIECERDDKTNLARATLRLRAVTEVI